MRDASNGRTRSLGRLRIDCRRIRDEPVQNLIAADHPELLPRNSLLRRGVGADHLFRLRQRIDHVLQRVAARRELTDAAMLAHDVECAVLPRLQSEHECAQYERTPDQPSSHQSWRLQSVQRAARKFGEITQLFFYAEKLVVLRDAVRAAGGTGLDLASVRRDREIGNERVLGLAGAMRDDAGRRPVSTSRKKNCECLKIALVGLN